MVGRWSSAGRPGRAVSSRDQAAVDAARAEPPLQRPLLLLGGQDGDDSLVEHGLQALLGQRRTFHVATRTDLPGRERARVRNMTVQCTFFLLCRSSHVAALGKLNQERESFRTVKTETAADWPESRSDFSSTESVGTLVRLRSHKQTISGPNCRVPTCCFKSSLTEFSFDSVPVLKPSTQTLKPNWSKLLWNFKM